MTGSDWALLPHRAVHNCQCTTARTRPRHQGLAAVFTSVELSSASAWTMPSRRSCRGSDCELRCASSDREILCPSPRERTAARVPAGQARYFAVAVTSPLGECL